MPDWQLPEPQRQELITRARRVLIDNHTGRFTKPSPAQYPHQWNWDAAFIVIGLRHVDQQRARQEVLALLDGQWRSGMVPHILYHDGPSSYFPTPDYWLTADLRHGADIATSGLTQPPLLATSVRLLVESMGESAAALELAREVYGPILAWHRWLHSARDPEGTGLVAIIHPWESGTDNSPRFAEPLSTLGRVAPPAYARGDLSHVSAGERPLAYDYDRFMHLIGVYREMNWEDDAIAEGAPFFVQDVFFNSILHRADEDLRELARLLGEPTEEMDGWLEASRRAFRERLWNDRDGVYYDLDLRTGRQLEERTAMTLSPLFAGLAGEEESERLVAEHLFAPEQYAPNGDSRYLVPSTAKSSRYYEPRRYWRGPVWLNLNWLLLTGLERYGRREEARTLRRHTLELAARTGFSEYYDPRDGSACGASGFSWSAAVTLDLLHPAEPGSP